MLKLISNSVLASEIAEFLGKEISGEDIVIYNPSNCDNIKDNTMLYIESPEIIKKVDLSGHSEILLFVKNEISGYDNIVQIVTEEPLNDFLKTIEKFFTIEIPQIIHEKATIEKGAKIGKEVKISAGCYIGADVEIGEGTVIWENSIIKGKVKIGKNCNIKSNSTIGSDVFNFVFTNDRWEQFPQIGEIMIEDDVWIGANSSVEKGTMGDTIIKKGTRVDDLVQIGSNCFIDENCLIAAGSIISRDVKIGKNCFIAPNVSIRDRVKIGDNVTIGIGAVVIKDVKPDITVAGNPAKELIKK